jgi:PAS domain S-box-containing protein
MNKLIAGLTFLVYLSVALLGLQFASLNANTSPFWPASGIAIALVWRFGYHNLFVIFLAALVANIYTETTLWACGLISLGNTLEAFSGAWILRRIVREAKITGAVAIQATALVALAPPLFSSLFGGLALYFSNVMSLAELNQSTLVWTLGNSLGILLSLPFFILKKIAVKFKRKPILFVDQAILAIFILALFFVFSTDYGRPFVFVLFPFVLAIRMRFGPLATLCSGLIIFGYSVTSASFGYGPFMWSTADENTISLQLFLISILCTSTTLSFSPLEFKHYFYKRTLLIGWMISGVIFFMSYSFHKSRDEFKLINFVKSAEANLEYHLQVYEQTLRSSSAFLRYKSTWTRKDWATYVQMLEIDKVSPGLLGLGVVKSIHPSMVQSFIHTQKKEGLADYQLKQIRDSTAETRDIEEDLFVIQYLEPIEKNADALGLILNSDKKRFDALIRSQKYQSSSSTAPISMIQDSKNRKGVAIFYPVQTSSKNELKWVLAPLVLEDFFDNVFHLQNSELDHSVYFDSKTSPPELLHSSKKEHNDFEKGFPHLKPLHSRIILADKAYQIHWKPSSTFTSSFDFGLALIGALCTVLVLFLAWIVLNISSLRLRLEEALEIKTQQIISKESTWRVLTTNSPVGIVTANLDGECTYANPSWEQLSGMSQQNAIGQGWINSLHPQDQERVSKEWIKFKDSNEPWETSFRFVHPDQSVRWATLKMSKIYSEVNQVESYIGVVVDYTKQIIQAKSLEQERLRSLEASKMASLGRMAGGIAHEINNPLTIIAAQAGTIKKQASALLNQEESSKIQISSEKILAMIQRISKIIRGLRTFSRNAQNDPLVKTSISSIIEDTLELCSERNKALGIKLSISGDIKHFIDCRPSQISQVLLNLISNSQDAVEKVGNKEIFVAFKELADHVEFRVSDTGPGIPEQFATKILDPFFTTKDIGKGTGLGLSIALGIVEDHMGTLILDRSAPLTTFIVRLPKAHNSVKLS